MVSTITRQQTLLVETARVSPPVDHAEAAPGLKAPWWVLAALVPCACWTGAVFLSHWLLRWP